jgi:hypothetical protein
MLDPMAGLMRRLEGVARKGESLEEYRDFTHRIFKLGDRQPNRILHAGESSYSFAGSSSARSEN